MTVYFGSARHDENGRLTGGAAGDQTGPEVMEQEGYVHKYGWRVFRPKQRAFALKLAKGMITACDNENVGYDQNGRSGIIKHGVKTKVKTEADCGTTVRACCIYAGADPGPFYTGNEAKVLLESGLFYEIPFTGLDCLRVGDVLVTKKKGHTVIVTRGRERAECYPKYKGDSVSIIDALKAVGEKDTSFKHRTKIAEQNNIRFYKGTAAQNKEMLSMLRGGTLEKTT